MRLRALPALTMTTELVLGIDGCRYGWIVASSQNDQLPTFSIHRHLKHLEERFGTWELALIDMPIGLPTTSSRLCDREARKRLGRSRSSSVFPVPCRAAMSVCDYETACLVNRQHLGVALSKQTWHILPKIRELDEWIRSTRAEPVRECHPELAFWALNGHKPLSHGKKSVAGQAERLDLLARRWPDIGPAVAEGQANWPKSWAALDDMLDAAILALTGTAGTAGLVSIPAKAERDDWGLPMEIVHATHPFSATERP